VAQGNGNEGVATKSKTSKAAAAANSSFGTNMPLMSSAFDTAMWLNAA
jgi:hypothetical protein